MKKLRLFLGRLHQEEKGITGLETAIILIAFVIVASVFAFVVLSTGLFSAERGKETVFAGLAKARGNAELRGSVTASAPAGTVVDIKFNLGNAAGGSPINVDPAATSNAVVINFIDAQARVADVPYTTTWIARDDTDTLMEAGDLVEVTVAIPGGSALSPNETFTLEVIPPSGGTLLITRTMPAAIDMTMDLH